MGIPTPAGVTAISRWLSEATPPVAEIGDEPHPGGMAEIEGFQGEYWLPSGIPAGMREVAGDRVPVVSLRSTTG